MKPTSLLLSSLILFTATTAYSQASISLESGTPIAVAANGNAVLSRGYAIVNPPGDNVSGLIYTGSDDERWTEQDSVSVPHGWKRDAVADFGVFSISDSHAVIGVTDDPSFSGIAYVFTRTSDDQWVQQAVLPGHSRAWDTFGKASAIWNDTIAVGSNPGGESSQSGRVTIYVRSDETWRLEQNIDTTYANPDDFGNTIHLSDDFLIIPHNRSTGAASSDIYYRTDNGWTFHSNMNGDHFALDENTLVAATPGVVRTYTLDAANNWREVSAIEYPDQSVESMGMAGQRLVVALVDEGKLYHYRKTDTFNWINEGDIDAMPSVPSDPSKVFLTVDGISDQYVMISRSAYPDGSEPIFDTHIVNLATNNNEQGSNEADLNATSVTSSSEQSNESSGGGGILDLALLFLALQLLGYKFLVAQLALNLDICSRNYSGLQLK